MITERRFEIVLRTMEPFRIGGKPDPLFGAENPVAIVGSQVVIPGSSLKGAFRSRIEQYLIERHYDAGAKRWPANRTAWRPCLGGPKPSEAEQRLVGEGKYRSLGCAYPAARDAKDASICPACYLLGAQGLVGFVRVPFLVSDVTPEELYSARIDRSTSTVARGTNRPYQLVPTGAIFKGTFYVTLEDTVLGWRLGEPRPLDGEGDAWLKTNAPSQEQLIKEFITDRLASIYLLGGYKSKGFGRVQIEVRPSG
ncbi:MAG: hypothetical protein H5T64_13165 [Chloroflexi bacterium]|nr:hypothetical protein [Chloroflexota bacterium]